MKRQANLQCIEKDKRNKTGTDEGNPDTAAILDLSNVSARTPHIDNNNRQMHSRPPSSQPELIAIHQGHVPIYDPIRAQMNTSNNGRNTPVYTQQMYPHPSMFQGALSASYPHYNAIAYNQRMVMQPTTSYHVGPQLREQHLNPAGVFAVGHRAYQTGRAQAENSDAITYSRQAMMQPTTPHHAWPQFRPRPSNQLQHLTNDLRYTSMHSGHYANDSSPVYQQTPAQPSTSQLGQTAGNQNRATRKIELSIQGTFQCQNFNVGSDNMYVDNRGRQRIINKMPPESSETKQNPATRRTIASRHEGKISSLSHVQEVTSGGCSASITSSEAGAELSGAPIREETRAADPVQHVDVRRSTPQFCNIHLSSPDVYLMDPNRLKGKVFIINNEFVGQEKRRAGSLVDVENLEHLWNQLGFEVTTKRNLKGEDMHRSCHEFAQNSVDINVLVMIIMSHGGIRDGEEVVCGEDNQTVSTKEIISFFTSSNAPHLRGIPKVLMFQACRGEDSDVIVEEFPMDANVRPRTYPERSDMLIVYPSQAGYASFRNRDTGSWLMNAVTTIFMRDAKDTHVLDMLTKVNRAISVKESNGCVQMSNQISYLTKNLFLFPGWPNQ